MTDEEKQTGWYRNEKGELCFEGQCFALRANPGGGFSIEFDETCDIEAAQEAERELRRSTVEGEVTVRRRKRHGAR